MTLPFVYRSIPALKRVIFPVDAQADSTEDGDLEILASAVGRGINNYTHRNFSPFSGTKSFDAPADICLYIPDLLPSPEPVVTYNGQTLTKGTDYLFRPNDLTELEPVYCEVVRLQAGLQVRWGWKHVKQALVSVPVSRGGLSDDYLLPSGIYSLYTPGPSTNVVTIQGLWGYTDLLGGVPSNVALAHEIITTQFWKARNVGYAFQQEQPPAPGQNMVTEYIRSNPYLQFLLDPLIWLEPEQDANN